MTQALDKPRPKKAKVETYQVDGRTITFTQVAVDQERHFAGETAPAQRGKWEVCLDGVLVGYAFYPKGVGNPWIFTSLVPKACKDFYAFGEPNYVHAWEPPVDGNGLSEDGRYADYNGLSGLLEKIVPWRGDLDPSTSEQWFRYEADWRWDSREQIAQWVPRFASNERLPDTAGVLALIEWAKAERERRRLAKIEEAAEQKRKEARWKVEREQRAAEAEQLRKDTLEGLTDIQSRLGSSLTNFEAAALAEAIKKFTA